MYFYAELDEMGVCISVKQVNGEMNYSNHIRIETYNSDLLNRPYNNGQWGEKILPVTPLPKETLEETIARLEHQIQQDNIVTFEVLATIYEELLNKGSV